MIIVGENEVMKDWTKPDGQLDRMLKIEFGLILTLVLASAILSIVLSATAIVVGRLVRAKPQTYRVADRYSSLDSRRHAAPASAARLRL